MPAIAPSFSTALVTTLRRLLCCCCALLVAACGGGSSTPTPSSEGPSLAASQGGALLEHVRAMLVRRDAQRQQNPGGTPLATAGSGPALAVAATGAPVAHSNTNVQEAGVDEEDLIKTDGASVYALDTTALSNSAAPSMRLLRAPAQRQRRHRAGADAANTRSQRWLHLAARSPVERAGATRSGAQRIAGADRHAATVSARGDLPGRADLPAVSSEVQR